MKLEAVFFGAGFFFFVPVGFLYGVLSGWHEPAGAAAIMLCGGMAILVGAYLWQVHKSIDPRPSDNPEAEIADGDPEFGFYSPYSGWPIVLAAGAAASFASFAIGWWVLAIGLGVTIIGIVGWFFEYTKGRFAH